MVSQVLMDHARNRATGVLYVDRNTHLLREIHARTVLLCAQTFESVRILLNSANLRYPRGLANSAGVLGRYLTAHVKSGGGGGGAPAFVCETTPLRPKPPAPVF